MIATSTRIQPITRELVVPVADALARAFHDNPSFIALLDRQSSEQRLRTLIQLQRIFVRATLDRGDASCILEDGRPVAALLAYPPGAYPWPLAQLTRFAPALLAMGLRGVRRGFHLSQVLDTWHIDRPHWYVFVLGVDPSHQGRGLGGALLARICELADRAAVESYLETDRHSSVRLYERHGYRVLHHEALPALQALEMWSMAREPRPSPAV
ncbi:MAG: GNAT family N-acetyltransferase [Deltaproteobacteria bacterium]|nr:GNAT family N-acetyltransferase [Deltaproteobacteria bacterium]